MKISVIVATKNEEKHIENCLMSIIEQVFPKENVEIIVVDNNSTDRTKEIAKRYTNKVINLVADKRTKNFRGAQVNQGFKIATGSAIFLPDADMTFDRNLFSEIAKKIFKYDALYIPETIMGKGLFGRVRNFERSFYNGTPIDAVRVIKRSIFKKVGGYDEKNIVFGADDWDLTKSIRLITNKISITKNKLFHHEELLDCKTFVEKKKKYVKTFDGYVKKWGAGDSDVSKQLGLKYRAFVVFTENGKWKKIIANPLLLLYVYVVRCITLFNYLTNK